MRHKPMLMFTPLLVASLACSTITALGSGKSQAESTVAAATAAPKPETTAQPPQPGGGQPGGSPPPPGRPGQYDTVFPLPKDVQNFVGEGGDGQVNFQTSLSLEDVIKFYREAFNRQGLTERTLLTAITDTTFSLVFDGWPNGEAIVIQGVSLGPNSTNVNIRFEDI